jgi:hypothetical protein
MAASLEVPVNDWRAGWVERTLPEFEFYSILVNLFLASIIAGLSVGWLRIRGCTNKLKTAVSASERAEISKELRQWVRTLSKGHYFVAIAYFANVFLIMGVDAYVNANILSTIVPEYPEIWSQANIIRMALKLVSLAAMFVAALVMVPLVQMLLATWLLSRFAQKRGVTTLSEYIPEATMYSTQIAQRKSHITEFLLRTC